MLAGAVPGRLEVAPATIFEAAVLMMASCSAGARWFVTLLRSKANHFPYTYHTLQIVLLAYHTPESFRGTSGFDLIYPECLVACA